jgi:hypothetical protein
MKQGTRERVMIEVRHHTLIITEHWTEIEEQNECTSEDIVIISKLLLKGEDHYCQLDVK